MKILYMQEYIERHLFVIEHEGKTFNVYRSSGLSGTGHEGLILPFSGLNTETRGIRALFPGYIFKEMYYNGMWVNHRKQLHYYPEVLENMKILKDFLKNSIPDTEITLDNFSSNEEGKEVFNWKLFLNYVEETKDNLKKYNKKPFDLKYSLK